MTPLGPISLHLVTNIVDGKQLYSYALVVVSEICNQTINWIVLVFLYHIPTKLTVYHLKVII